MKTTVKKSVKPLIILAVLTALAIAAWQSTVGDGVYVNIDGDEVGGPLGAALGVLFAGGGLLIAAVAVTCAAVFVGVLFAGLGILMVGGMALLAIVIAAAVSPLLIPLLIPLGIYWFFSARSRKQRARIAMEQAV